MQFNNFLNFAIADLMVYLDFDAVKQFMKPGATKEEFDKMADEEKKKDPLQEAINYLSFAWDKANNCRGLSAGRSIDHFRAWLWLAGKDDFLQRVDLKNYNLYGKPQLRAICEELEIDWKDLDDGKWRNDESGYFKKPEEVQNV